MITDIDKIYVIDLREEYTTVRGALLRADFELATARTVGVKVAKLIHGSTESGRPNYLAEQVRSMLRREFGEGRIRMVIQGERYMRGNSMTADLIDNCPFVDGDPDLDSGSADFTVVYF